MKTKPLIQKTDLLSVVFISFGLLLIAIGIIWMAIRFNFEVQVVIPLIAFGVAFLADLVVIIIYVVWFINSKNIKKKGIIIEAKINKLINKSEDGKYFEHPYLISYEYEYNGKRYYSENESIPEAYYQYLHDENISTIEIKAYKNLAMLKGKEY